MALSAYVISYVVTGLISDWRSPLYRSHEPELCVPGIMSEVKGKSPIASLSSAIQNGYKRRHLLFTTIVESEPLLLLIILPSLNFLMRTYAIQYPRKQGFFNPPGDKYPFSLGRSYRNVVL